jgi:lysophospholipid acyltransferase (LPLAT)-like uncharacterized protein
VIRLITRVVVWGIRILFWTVRTRFRVVPGTNPLEQREGERFLYAMWHDSILVPLFADRITSTAALTSRHADGEYVAEMLRMLNVVAVRGSSKRGGAAAVRRLMDEASEKHIVITPDGPRGPRRQMKPGIVYLASQSGRRIVPTAFDVDRAWRIAGSWTDQLIPKPFSTAYLMSGEPIAVPPNLSKEELDAYTQRVQEAMDELEEELQRWMRGEGGSLKFEVGRVKSAA